MIKLINKNDKNNKNNNDNMCPEYPTDNELNKHFEKSYFASLRIANFIHVPHYLIQTSLVFAILPVLQMVFVFFDNFIFILY